nr:MAG TPA: PPAT adenylyltransferase [Caudoviricetes sp.]
MSGNRTHEVLNVHSCYSFTSSLCFACFNLLHITHIY